MLKIKIKNYEKYLNLLWAIIALSLAYGTFKEFLIAPEIELLIWLPLHIIAAVLFFIRHQPIQYSSSAIAYLIALASVNYYLLYDLTIDLNAGFISIGRIITIVGGIMCIISTISLGKYFGVLPVYRGIQTAAAYQLIRHPIYASYIVLDIGILTSYPSFGNLLIFCIAVLLFVLRIRYEEEVLQCDEEYLKYKRKVKYKLLPMLY